MTDTKRLLVTGPRDYTDEQFVHGTLTSIVDQPVFPGHVILVHGDCPTGVDHFAQNWADNHGALLGVTAERHPAQNHPTQDFGPWPNAGPARNKYMAGLGAARCVAFIQPCTSWRCRRTDPHGSHGTASCIRFAVEAGIPVERITL